MSNEETYQINNSFLSGRRISFMAKDNSGQQKFVFSGRAEDGTITGTV
jgi:hypothetical protein